MWLERWGTARAERVVCVSASVAEHCRRYGFPSEKLVVIPNGVNIQRASRVEPANLKRFGVAPGRKALLFAGRLDRQKGIDAFFPHVAKILEDFPDWAWVIAGDGPLRTRLVRQAATSRAAPRIHFVGWQPEVLPLVAASELLILPSRWEGMPNVVLEAMACGKPVLATRTEGVAELLGEATEEQTVPPEDWNGLAQRLRAWLADPAERQRLGTANQRRADHFSVEKMVGRYTDLYEHVLRVTS
jgi:glycosyltransferase involved in cell wall biosynthesis